MKRSAMKRSQPKRDWAAARAKVEEERQCRVCKLRPPFKIEAAHIIGRQHDRDSRNGLVPRGDPNALFVRPDRIVPLCGGPNGCHGKYDAHELDLLPALTLDEQLQAVRDAGSIQAALRRTAPSVYHDTFRGEAQQLKETT